MGNLSVISVLAELVAISRFQADLPVAKQHYPGKRGKRTQVALLALAPTKLLGFMWQNPKSSAELPSIVGCLGWYSPVPVICIGHTLCT